MSGAPYNGYDWRQRNAILTAYKHGAAGEGFTFAGKSCGMCGDPDRAPGEWHSEDYSPPFLFEPPATYPVCGACHGRIHKRFNLPAAEWDLFCLHLESGGHGREFTKLYSLGRRRAWVAAIDAGETVVVPHVRDAAVPSRWWRELTLDPSSLEAPWARPRPWRPRPDNAAYREAIGAIGVSADEERLIRLHASTPRRSATMRDLAQGALGKDAPSAANLLYGRLAHRLCNALQWTPDKRADGSPIWMSVIAEGWQPPTREGRKREYEWAMVPTLAEMWRE